MSAARAGDLDSAERLAITSFPEYSSTGRLATVDRWLAQFDREELTSRPLLMVVAGYSKWINGVGAAATEWLALASATATTEYPETEPGWGLPVALALLRANIGSLPAAEMAEAAQYAYEHLAPGAPWRPVAGILRDAATFMLGDSDTAERSLREAAFGAAERPMVRAISLAHLAVVHIEREEWDTVELVVDELRPTTDDQESIPGMCLASAVISLVDARRGDADRATERRRLCRGQLGGFDGISPWLNLQVRIALASSATTTGQRAEASTLLEEAEEILAPVPDAVGVREQLATLRRSVSTQQHSGSHGPSSLTTAELRASCSTCPTHLTIAEIAERLFVSRNTVKSQSISIYRKLGTSSRGGAVEIAREAQLID